MSKNLSDTRNRNESGLTTRSSVRRVNSAYLFSGASTLIIEHHGATYMLRVTRQDKLILTK